MVIHSYAQDTHILIHILKYSSALIVFGVRLTKYQQTHADIPPANDIFVYILIGTPIVPLTVFLLGNISRHFVYM